MTGTQDTELILINEAFYAERVTRHELDTLLANGWRHFGERFQRYSLNYYRDEIRRVVPLRVDLEQFRLSKSQRRTLNKNSDLRMEVRPIDITEHTLHMFRMHRYRFTHDRPPSIYTFLSEDPARVPTDGMELRLYKYEEPLAISFFDLSTNGLSSVYGMFFPAYEHRRLGILTMLKEIEYARSVGKRYYYSGYAYEGESFYDYKKRFSGLEAFDWKGHWIPFNK
jgi:arginyl-tRNA--protein-N-Asp/Glu arginylyltransferase